MMLVALMTSATTITKAQEMGIENPFYNTLLNSLEVQGEEEQLNIVPGQQATSYNTGSRDVQITVLLNEYVFPYHMSTDGQYIAISAFGGGGAFWSAATGLISVPGDVYAVSDGGTIGGTFLNPDVLHNGSPVNTAGRWDHTTSQWTFLGMNPDASVFSADYNSGWGINGSGDAVVGMQYMSSYANYKAFKWTETGGYELIGNVHPQGSRASGISANGATVYGWAQMSFPRTPAIWKDGQMILVDNTQGGESFGASADGNYVTGKLGNNGFLWSPDQPLVTFPNSINTGSMSPTCVTNDGSIFGFNNTAWPPVPWMRRAFARDNQGNMITFNDYAESRGLPNAQNWTFYSINHVTPDGNKFIGAGITPEGQDISFLMEFPVGTTVLPGDANCDGVVNVIDVITIANYIMGANPEPFCFENADIDGDGVINVFDMIGTVNIIAGEVN